MSKGIPFLDGGGGWATSLTPYEHHSSLMFSIPRQYDPNFAFLVQWKSSEAPGEVTLTKVGLPPYLDDADGDLSLHFMPDGSIKAFYGLDAENPYLAEYYRLEEQYEQRSKK